MIATNSSICTKQVPPSHLSCLITVMVVFPGTASPLIRRTIPLLPREGLWTVPNDPVPSARAIRRRTK